MPLPASCSSIDVRPVDESVVPLAGVSDPLVVDGERHADGREARSRHLAREVECRPGSVGGREWNVDVVVGVDADRVAHDLRDHRLDLFDLHSRSRHPLVVQRCDIALVTLRVLNTCLAERPSQRLLREDVHAAQPSLLSAVTHGAQGLESLIKMRT
jgi:hypothetical protein